jgi:hypothetical protein
MKALWFLVGFVAVLAVSSAFAQQVNDLFVMDDGTQESVSSLLEGGFDIASLYGVDQFCYQGNADVVLRKLDAYKKAGNFFTGENDGMEYLGGRVNRGFVTYDLALTFGQEGERETKIVKPCVNN